jgi:hypothetical protein
MGGSHGASGDSGRRGRALYAAARLAGVKARRTGEAMRAGIVCSGEVGRREATENGRRNTCGLQRGHLFSPCGGSGGRSGMIGAKTVKQGLMESHSCSGRTWAGGRPHCFGHVNTAGRGLSLSRTDMSGVARPAGWNRLKQGRAMRADSSMGTFSRDVAMPGRRGGMTCADAVRRGIGIMQILFAECGQRERKCRWRHEAA